MNHGLLSRCSSGIFVGVVLVWLVYWFNHPEIKNLFEGIEGIFSSPWYVAAVLIVSFLFAVPFPKQKKKPDTKTKNS